MQDDTSKNQNTAPVPMLTPTIDTPKENEKPAFMSLDPQAPETITSSSTPILAVAQETEQILSGDPQNPFIEQPFVITPASGNTIGPSRIATMLGIIVLVIGIGAGLFLLQRRQGIGTQAWDCHHYVFNVSQTGLVTINTQGYTGSEADAQKVNVLINNTLIKTFDIGELGPNENITLGTVTVPNSGVFTWQAVGTSDCSTSGTYSTQITCDRCQYQTDVFWGPLIQSFASGARYDTRRIDSRSSRNPANNDTNLPVCSGLTTNSPQSVTIPTLTSGCVNPVANGYLTTTMTKTSDNFWEATIRNTTTQCTYAVGEASYKTDDSLFSSNQNQYYATQTILDSQEAQLGPGESKTLKVKAPTVFCGQSTPTPSPSPTGTARPSSSPTASPSVSPSPTGNTTCINKDVDIAIVLDRSGSMNSKESDGRTKLAWAIDGAKTLINTLGANTKVSVASFGAQGNDGTGTLSSAYNTTLDLALNPNLTTVLSAINNIKFNKGGTCIECGIRIGRLSLASSTVKKYLVLLSDGGANHTWDGTSASTQATLNAKTEGLLGRTSGITFFVLGYGSNVNTTVLKDIAGDSSRYYFSPTTANWNNIFSQIGERICTEPTPSPTPNFTAQCVNLKAYDTDWNQIPIDNLSSLKAGDIVRFSVMGTSSSGGFDKARFIINGTTRAETVSKRPATDEYYDEYVIPAGVTNFTVSSQLHHQSQNQWY